MAFCKKFWEGNCNVRVLIVSQYFFPEVFRINDLVASLVERGVSVDILTGKPNYPEGVHYSGYRGWGFQVEQLLGAKVYRLPMVARGKRGAIGLFFNYLSFVLSGLIFAPWLLRGQKYDLVFVYGLSPILQAIPALFVAWLKRLKVIIWVQDLWPESLAATGYVRNKMVLSCLDHIVRFIYFRSDLLLVQSKGFVPRVSAMAHGKQAIYYPNSVDSMFFAPPTVTIPAVTALDSGFSVMFAGNVGAGQAVEVIVNAAILLKGYTEICFVVFGQGSRWEWMREQVQQHALTNLHLPGKYPIETMPGLMQKASALLVSLSDQPIFAATIPNKVQAYMAAGRPIIACLNGEGARLVSEAGAGITVAAEDAQGLADAVLLLSKMPSDETDAMGANGRRYFKAHFDHEHLTTQLIGHFLTQVNSGVKI